MCPKFCVSAFLVSCFVAAPAMGQVGWEAETKIEVFRVNPQTKKFLQLSVRDPIPTGNLAQIQMELTGLPAGCTKQDIFGATHHANVWAWTVDGVQTISKPYRPDGGNILWRDTSWARAVTLYNAQNAANRMTTTCNDANLTRLNQWIRQQWDDHRAQVMSTWRSLYTGPGSVAPPVIGIPRFFGKFTRTKTRTTHYCHRDANWFGFEAGPGLAVQVHDEGYTSILEFKTAAPGGAPFSAASLDEHRRGWTRIEHCLLNPNVKGRIVIKVSPTDHWILQVNKGVKFKQDKDIQFTFNIALENLHEVDMAFGWPDAPVSAGVTQLQKNLQRYILKNVVAANQVHMDKNSQSPFVKQTTWSFLPPLFETVGAFQATKNYLLTNWREGNLEDWIRSSAAHFDDFLKACLEVAPSEWYGCLSPYFDIDVGGDYGQPTRANGKHYVTVEERVNARSVGARYPFTGRGPIQAADLAAARAVVDGYGTKLH